MGPFQGIAVQIISNGEALKLYDDPDATEIEEVHSRHHYVEAIVGSTFQVKVDLTPQFKFHHMDAEHAVSILLEIDGHDNSLIFHSTKKELQEQFSRNQFESFVFTGPTHFCKETGRWMASDYSFGNLVLKENADPEFSIDQAQGLGKIQVTIQRVKRVKRKVPYIQSTTPIATINEVPEKALKGRPIETSVRFTNACPSSAPDALTMDDKRIGGETGKPMVFNMYYRSRRALQMMGIIPRSPSPDVQTLNDETRAPPEDIIQQEVRDLRARLALLERGLNVKPESSSAATNRLKRERDEEESNQGSRQRRRTSVKAEHIDLTDDRPRRRSPVKVEHVDLTDD